MMLSKIHQLCYLVLCIGIASPNSFYTPSFKSRRSPEFTLYREETTPEVGGKVPESAHMRLHLNQLDVVGIDDPNSSRMIEEMKDMHLPEKMDETSLQSLHTDPAPHNPGYYEPEPYHPAPPATYHEPEPYHPAPPATYHEPEPYHPGPYHEPEPYHPPATYHEPEPYHPPSSYHEPEPYHPEPEPYHPPSTYHEPEPYHPEPYHPPPHSGYHEPEPYHPPSSDYGAPAPSSDYGAPKPYKPKAPVMLEKRPYEPKEIKPVTITTHEAYTGFDCRKVPYPDRHYADPEAGCSIYHYCHADGKQDTFHCSYGTIFNEYLGTCDHASAVLCKGGEGYAGPPHTPHHAPHHAPHHVTHDHHAPHHAPHHVTHHAPSPHHVSHHSPHHDVTPAHHGFSGPNFNFPAGFGSGF